MIKMTLGEVLVFMCGARDARYPVMRGLVLYQEVLYYTPNNFLKHNLIYFKLTM